MVIKALSWIKVNVEIEFLNIDDFPDLIDTADTRESVDARIISEHLKQHCEKALFEREWTVLYLTYWEGLNLSDIAKKYNRTSETIRKVLAKAIRKLRHPKHRDIFREIQWVQNILAIRDKEAKQEAEEWKRGRRERERLKRERYEKHREESRIRRIEYLDNLKKEAEEYQFGMSNAYAEQQRRALELERIRKERDYAEALEKGKRWQKCPPFVILTWHDGVASLYCDPTTGYVVDRNLCPDLYDQWLKERLEEDTKCKATG